MRIARVYIGPVVDEGLDGARRVRFGGEVKRGDACVREAIRVRTPLQQHPYYLAVPAPAREVKRSVPPKTGSRLHGRAGVQQSLGNFDIVVNRGPVQGGRAVRLRGAGVSPVSQQRAYGLDVAALCGIGHRRLRRRRSDRGGHEQ